MRNLFLFAGILLPILGAVSTLASSESTRDTSSFSFDPLAFNHHVATCPGINRSTNKTVDLQLRMPIPQPIFNIVGPTFTSQAMLILTLTWRVTPVRHSCYYMAGQVSGPAGSIKSGSSW